MANNYFRSPRLLAYAKGQSCQNCQGNICPSDTTVAAHSNEYMHGKGRGIKAHDNFIAFLGIYCHKWYDVGAKTDPSGTYGDWEKERMFYRAHSKTMLIVFRAIQDGTLKL